MKDNNNILVPFNVVLDTDMGLAKLIYFFYRDNYFNLDILSDDETLKYILLLRDEENPLTIIAKDPSNIDELGDLYKQFIDQEYKNILRLSNITSIAKLIKLSAAQANAGKYTILCKNDLEVEALKARSIDKDVEIIIESDRSKIDISKYSIIYLRHSSEISLYNDEQMYTKNIYIGNYGFNLLFDEESKKAFLNPEYILKYTKGRHIDFYVYSVYDSNEFNIFLKDLKEDNNNGK